MYKIVFKASNGKSITLGSNAPMMLLSVNETGNTQAEIHSKRSPFQDGVTLLDTQLKEKGMLLEVAILTRSQEELFQHRETLSRIFNPKLGLGELTYHYPGGVRKINAVAESTPSFLTGARNFRIGFQRVAISLFCPSPLWMDDMIKVKELITWIGGMTFPWNLPLTFAEKGPLIANVVNKGDVETPVRILFKGPATNPKVTKRKTGEYIQVNRTLDIGDELTISTEFGKKRVEINGENVFHWIDIGSTFWHLDIGDNVLEYSSSEPTEPASVTIEYYNRYVGV